MTQVLLLPGPIREAMAKLPGPGWRIIGPTEPGGAVEADLQVEPPTQFPVDRGSYQRAWLPADPCTVLAFTAQLAGSTDVYLESVRPGWWQAGYSLPGDGGKQWFRATGESAMDAVLALLADVATR